MNRETAVDVIIVGAGPVGLTLANLLASYGVRIAVIDRNAGLEAEPRAVTLDDESLRTMQNAGLLDRVVKDLVLGYGVQYFDWRGKPLASIQPTRQEYGYPKRNAFRQPLLVQALYAGLQRFEASPVRFSHELVSLTQDTDRVQCQVRTVAGESLNLEAAWVVGCDGGRSKVRELCEITLDGDTFPERWLIVDLANRTLPLRHTRTYCDPRRPAIRLPGPGGSLRYEFMLRPGDRDEEVLDDASFRRWIAERVPEDANLPLVRKAIYGFHARVATRWKTGRVLLAGDAAHLTPPFAGQGLNSGLRDAANLAWKLAAVTRWGSSAELLESYEQERRPHAAALIRMALRIGSFMQPKSIPGAALTQGALRLACLIPACRDYILQLRFKPKPQLRAGYFLPSPRQAHSDLLPQPPVEHRERGTVLLDELLSSGFAVIGWDSPAFRAQAAGLIPKGAPGRVLALLRQEDDFLDATAGGNIDLARDISGELGALLDRCQSVAVVIRPDRYVYRLLNETELKQSLLPTSIHQESALPLHSTSRRLATVCVAVALGGFFTPYHGIAQSVTPAPAFPTKPVRLLTAFPTGSGPEVALRVVAERLSKKWGQPVIVDNRPGGNGFIAIGLLKQAAPDGYTLIQLDSNHLTTHPHTFSKLPYNAQKDLDPIRPLFRNHFFIVVAKDSPYNSLDDIIAAAKAKPGRINYGSWFNGSPGHLGALRLQKLKEIEMVHVPYKEMTQLYSAVATQEVHWALGSAASAGALEKAGKVKFVAIAGPTPSKAYPEAPTVDQSATTKGYEVASWTGLFAPAGTPKALRESISTDVLEAVKSSEVEERYRAFDYGLFDVGPDAYADVIRRETNAWGDIISAAGLKLD